MAQEEPTMTSLEQQLSRWVEHRVIDEPAAARIRSFEESQRPAESRPGVIEVVAYLAAAIIAAGVLVLVTANWNGMGAVARIAVPGLSAAATIATGAAIRTSNQPGVRRGGQVAWLVGTALTATTAAVAAHEAGAPGEWVAVTSASVTFPLALALWMASKTHVQVVGLAASAVLCSMAVVSVVAERGAEERTAFALGAMLACFSGLAIVAVELKALTPASSSRALAGLGVVIGVIYLGVQPGPPWAEASGFVAGGLLLALCLRQGVFVYTAVAVISMFVALSTIILRHVDAPTVAAIPFIAVGIALLAGIVVLERLRPWAHTGGKGHGSWMRWFNHA
jgi:hypothetical protein